MIQWCRRRVARGQPHPKSFELVKIRAKSPKIRAKCEEIWAKYVPIFAKFLHVAIGAWGAATKTSLYRLNTIHNKIIKTISWSSFRCHATPAYSQLNLLKLEDIHQLEIAKLMHNFHSSRMPNTFDRLFTAIHSVHTHENRSSTSGQYFCHPVCSQYGKRSIKFKGPRIWQQMDSSLKELSAIIFTKRYKNSIMESYKNHE